MTEIKELASLLIKHYVDSSKEESLRLNENSKIPIGVSGRHIHLSKKDLERLFGVGYKLTPIKKLTQPKQFACKEQVILAGPKGVIEKVRVLGPERKETQIEILMTDAFKLGVKPEIRMSGDIKDTPGITIIGPKGSIIVDHGVIVAQRHLHLNHQQSKSLKLKNNDVISVKTEGIRAGRLDNIIVRVSEDGYLDCHIDQEEANSFGLRNGSYVHIVR